MKLGYFFKISDEQNNFNDIDKFVRSFHSSSVKTCLLAGQFTAEPTTLCSRGSEWRMPCTRDRVFTRQKIRRNLAGADGDRDDEETESSDEEAFVRLENGN